MQAPSQFRGMDVYLMGRNSSPFSSGIGGVVQYQGVTKEKSPDFGSPKVGISVFYHGTQRIQSRRFIESCQN